MRRAAIVSVAALAALVACGERVVVEPAPGQILLRVDTDAPVPRPGTASLGPFDPAPLFDRLRIEIFAPGQVTPCEGCVNEFAIDEDVLRRRAASVGVAPLPDVPGYRARVRLFLRRLADAQGEPDPDATLDTTVLLPPVSTTGKREVRVVLRTENVASRVGTLEAPAEAAADDGAASLVGSWPEAARVDCAAPPPSGMVCVPGGAFWMGDRRKPWAVLPFHDVTLPRLVVLSPFYLDATEVRAGAYRSDPLARSFAHTNNGGDAFTDYCTITVGDGPQPLDDHPANCMPWSNARDYCRRRGADLPTEAQLEYVGSGLSDHAFPWGEDLPECEDAITSRTGWGMFVNSTAKCRPPTPYGGPEPVGRGVRDRLVLPTGTLVDLVGNVAEWTRDAWNKRDEPCWVRPGVYVDPLCVASRPSVEGDRRSVRGGNWLVTGGQVERTNRASAPTANFASPEVGLRCTKLAAPKE